MSSLDISRRNLALRGREIFAKVINMADYAREEINAIGGYYAYGKELVNGDSIFDFDPTKLSIHTRDIGLAGIEVKADVVHGLEQLAPSEQRQAHGEVHLEGADLDQR